MRARGRAVAVSTFVLLWCVAAILGEAHASRAFANVAEKVGVTYRQRQEPYNGVCVQLEGAAGTVCESDNMTGGVAIADFDGNGFPDLFCAVFDGPAVLYCNDNGTFTNCTAGRGLNDSPEGNLRTNSAVWGDVDNDGDLDLFVASFNSHRHQLYINDGTGHFTEEGAARGADVFVADFVKRPAGFSLGDLNHDGYLDVVVGQWHDLFPAVPFAVLLNRGDEGMPGHFRRAEEELGFTDHANPIVWVFATAIADFDNDGYNDVVVVGDFGNSRMFYGKADGTFEEFTQGSGFALDENGMGLAISDLDGDGFLDIFVTSIADPDVSCPTCVFGRSGNRLYHNLGNRHWQDIAHDVGVFDGYWGWGAAFLDATNAGREDIVMTNGVRFPGMDTQLVRFWWDPTMYFARDDCSAPGLCPYTNVAADIGINATESGKALFTLDYNQDGLLDFFEVNNGHVLSNLYKNEAEPASTGHFVRIRVSGLGGGATHVDGYGAKVWLTPRDGAHPRYTQIGATGHFYGQGEQETTLHFGVGNTTGFAHQLRVEFPTQHFAKSCTLTKRLCLDHVVEVHEPAALGESECVVTTRDLQHRIVECTACRASPTETDVCSGAGTCTNGHTGACMCDEGRFGVFCASVCPGGAATPCSGHGVCDDGADGSGTCSCDVGWAGTQCEECADGFYGASCEPCSCSDPNDSCDDGLAGSGVCTCDLATLPPGAQCSHRCPRAADSNVTCDGRGSCERQGETWRCVCWNATVTGDACEECTAGHFGDACTPCPGVAAGAAACHGRGVCDDGRAGDGTCTCNGAGFDAECSDCRSGWWGATCAQECPGGADAPCSQHGLCDDGLLGDGTCTCHAGFAAPLCADCTAHFFGVDCVACPAADGQVCAGHGACLDGVTGSGACVCAGNRGGEACEACKPGTFGAQCDECACVHGECDEGLTGSGRCTCDEAWRGEQCDQVVDGAPALSPLRMVAVLLCTALVLLL